MNLSLILPALILSTIMILICQNFFLKKKMTDKINIRSSHTVIATRSGGLAIFSTIFMISVFNYLYGITIFDYSYLIPIGLLVSVGLYDDLFNVDFKLKFIFQIIAAKMIIDGGLIIDNFHGLLGVYEINRLLAHLVTIFIVVAIINAMNFIDGIDGLAISVLSLFLILYEYVSISSAGLNDFSLIIIFTLIPVYYFNFKKNNKVFLGDSGSLMIGGITSIYVLNVLSNNYLIKTEFDVNKIIFVFSILSYPIIDIVRITIKRLIEKKSPFEADKSHIHHILLRRFKDHYKVVSIIILSSLVIFYSIKYIF